MPKKRLVVCAIFANQAARLAEWLAYHHLAGVGHFVLYDNGSTDDPARVVRELPLAEHVTLIRWPQQPGQVAAYRHFIDIFAPGFEWAAFLEMDEFLLPLDSRNVVDRLDAQGNAAAVLVHRRSFAPGDAQQLVIEASRRRADDAFPANRHVRTIARCSELQDVTQNAHEFRINGLVVDTAGRPVANAAVQERACHLNLVVNHYCTGDRDNWLARLRQQIAPAEPPTDLLGELSRIEDNAIQAFVPDLRRLLGLAAPAVPKPRPEPVAETTMLTKPVPELQPELVLEPAPMQEPGPVVGSAPVMQQAPLPEPVAQGEPASAEPPRQPETVAATAAPGWVARGEDARERVGFALVFRDRSRNGEYWLAALRGSTAGATDPAFLTDDFARIRDFPSEAAACGACDAALAEAARNGSGQAG